MRQFIDNLISRLEEKKKVHLNDEEFCLKIGKTEASVFCSAKARAVDGAIEVVNQLAEEYKTGEISDGYHTFNELYHHRAVLFATICNSNKELAWKSKLHDTGDMYEGMFIVGIETPQGQATYHYDIEPYWDMFKVKELPKAPKWDGHTPDEAIKRIGVLAEEYKGGWIPCSVELPKYMERAITCDEKGNIHVFPCDGKYFLDECCKRITENHERYYVPIAWMPLPEPYRKEGE